MAFELTHSEARRLETSIATALQSFKAGDVSEAQMIEFIRRLVDSAALDNHATLTDWLYSERVNQWRKNCANQ